MVTTYALWDALKHMYAPWRLESTVANYNPAWMAAAKSTDGGGEDYSFYVEYDIPGRSNTFAVAQRNAGRVRHAKFAMTFADDHSVIQIGEKLLAGSNTSAKAIRNTMKVQTDGALTALRNSCGRNMFGDGSGSVGAISATAALGTTTLLFADALDVVNFHEGQQLVFALNAASALRSTTPLAVTRVDELGGSVTLSATPNSLAAGIAVGDLIFTEGDYVAAADRRSFLGFAAWIPTTAEFAANSTIFGYNRVVNRTSLAGYYFSDAAGGDYAGFNEDDALQLAGEYISRGGGVMNTCFMNPFRIRRLINAIGSVERYYKKVPFTAAGGKVVATLGYEVVKVATPAGIIECIGDRNCPRDSIYAGDKDKLQVVSISSVPHWAGPQAQSGRPMENALAREFRLVAWPQFGIKRPRSWCRFDFV